LVDFDSRTAKDAHGAVDAVIRMETRMRMITTGLLALFFLLAPANMQPVQDGPTTTSGCVKSACFVGS
jgi:hypothetical protein